MKLKISISRTIYELEDDENEHGKGDILQGGEETKSNGTGRWGNEKSHRTPPMC